jgi:hypothetical protein
LECLANNSSLEELNISHNRLIDISVNRTEEDIEEAEDYIIEQMKSFLISNQRLIHLFLNQCSLSYRIIVGILPYIKFSPSLVAVHLQNIDFTQEKIEIVIKMLDLQVL